VVDVFFRTLKIRGSNADGGGWWGRSRATYRCGGDGWGRWGKAWENGKGGGGGGGVISMVVVLSYFLF
jgi:hypothetical protein